MEILNRLSGALADSATAHGTDAPMTNGDNGASRPIANGDNGAPVPAADKPGRGRDGQGRFAKGNLGGPGNPFARQIAGFRRALCNAVTDQDIHDLAHLLLAKAREGDLMAVKLLFLYALGRPAEVADPDTLDAQEMQLFQRNNADDETMAELVRGTPAELAISVLRLALPARAQEVGGILAKLLPKQPDTDAAIPAGID